MTTRQQAITAEARRPPTRRSKDEILATLLAAARRHVTEYGTAELSVRALAREIGLTSSAVYRHVESRDDLIRLLTIDIYSTVADVAEKADRAEAGAGAVAGGRWLGVCRAVRQWAREHQHEFGLLNGSPIPVYGPVDEGRAVAVRVWRVVQGIMDSAISSGELQPPVRPFEVAGLLDPRLAMMAEGQPGPPFTDARVRTLALFTSLLGTVAADAFGHFDGLSPDPDRLFDLVVATAAAGVGLRLPV